MTLKVYNDLTNRKEEFQPLDPPLVKMYVCGITPYDETHLGHGRAYVTFDIVRRYLENSGYKVTHVQNITDVDDKIINKSKELGVRSEELVNNNVRSFGEVMEKLNVKPADIYPKATEHIPEMVRWIGGLVDRGFAYLLPDGVYFEVSKFKDYGKLSGRKLEEMEAGARVEVHEGKRSPLDFALWKNAKEGEPSWESPWGAGRPGWHIECSAMSTKYLGEQFDIHGGGLDLEFPHHENEIAQTEALTGKVPWVKYWLHNGFINVNRQKMSKSLGNFFTLKEIFDKFDPMVVRFFLLSTHYRSPINYSDGEITAAGEGYSKIVEFIKDVDFILTKTVESSIDIELEDLQEELDKYNDKFKLSMDDDFNTAGALAAIFEMIRFCRKTLKDENEKECLELMRSSVIELCGVLGLNIEPRTSNLEHKTEIDQLVEERETARKNKDFKWADQIRRELDEKGIMLEDTPYGTKWKTRS